MRRMDPEAENLFEGHVSHFICIGELARCSRPKGILDVDKYAALIYTLVFQCMNSHLRLCGEIATRFVCIGE